MEKRFVLAGGAAPTPSCLLTIDLSLPHRVSHAPEGGQHKERPALVGVGHPREEVGDDCRVDGGTEDKDGQAAQVLDHDAEAEGAGRVGDAVGDQDEAHVLHAVPAAVVESTSEPFFYPSGIPFHRCCRKDSIAFQTSKIAIFDPALGLALFTDVAESKLEDHIRFQTGAVSIPLNHES